MEALFKKSFNRFKSKFLRYFLTYVLGVGLSLLTIIALLLVGGLFVLIVLITGKSPIIISLLAIIYTVGVLIALLFVGTWSMLAKLTAISDQKTADVMDCFKQTRSNVFSFLGFSILSGLFFLGIFYTNILLFIPAILWVVWGSLAQYAFIEGHRGGLKPLWYSKAKIKNNFMKISLYIAVIYVSMFVISFLFIQINEKMAYVNGLMYFLATPFILAYLYEIYKSLPEPTEVTSPKGWLVVSVIGWVISIALVGFTVSQLPKELKNLDMNKLFNELQKNSQYPNSYGNTGFNKEILPKGLIKTN